MTELSARVSRRRPPPNVMWIALCFCSAGLIWIGIGMAAYFGAFVGVPFVALGAYCGYLAFKEEQKS